jgi:hypothetical protein
MAFTLRVHEYAVNPQTAERELVAYRPLLRLGCSSADGYSGEIVYLQGGCVYGEGGAAYTPDDLPNWFGAALAACNPQALADVGFTPKVVQEYVTNRGQDLRARDEVLEVWEQGAPYPPAQPASPPGFNTDKWVLGFLCPRGHDYQHTGKSRYGKDMRCVDCHNARKRAQHVKRKEASHGTP